MKKLQMRQITIISRPTLRLIRDKNPHCSSGGKNSSTQKHFESPPETACGSTTKGSQFGSFVKRNFYFLAKRSSLDFFDYFLCQDNPPKADRWFHWKKHKKMKQKVSIFFVKTICQGRSMIPLKEEKNKAKSKYMNLSLIFPDNANDGI